MIPGLYNFLSCIPVDVLCMGHWHEGVRLDIYGSFMFYVLLLSAFSALKYAILFLFCNVFISLYSIFLFQFLLSLTALSSCICHLIYSISVFGCLMCDILGVDVGIFQKMIYISQTESG